MSRLLKEVHEAKFDLQPALELDELVHCRKDANLEGESCIVLVFAIRLKNARTLTVTKVEIPIQA